MMYVLFRNLLPVMVAFE